MGRPCGPKCRSHVPDPWAAGAERALPEDVLRLICSFAQKPKGPERVSWEHLGGLSARRNESISRKCFCDHCGRAVISWNLVPEAGFETVVYETAILVRAPDQETARRGIRVQIFVDDEPLISEENLPLDVVEVRPATRPGLFWATTNWMRLPIPFFLVSPYHLVYTVTGTDNRVVPLNEIRFSVAQFGFAFESRMRCQRCLWGTAWAAVCVGGYRSPDIAKLQHRECFRCSDPAPIRWPDSNERLPLFWMAKMKDLRTEIPECTCDWLRGKKFDF